MTVYPRSAVNVAARERHRHPTVRVGVMVLANHGRPGGARGGRWQAAVAAVIRPQLKPQEESIMASLFQAEGREVFGRIARQWGLNNWDTGNVDGSADCTTIQGVDYVRTEDARDFGDAWALPDVRLQDVQLRPSGWLAERGWGNARPKVTLIFAAGPSCGTDTRPPLRDGASLTVSLSSPRSQARTTNRRATSSLSFAREAQQEAIRATIRAAALEGVETLIAAHPSTGVYAGRHGGARMRASSRAAWRTLLLSPFDPHEMEWSNGEAPACRLDQFREVLFPEDPYGSARDEDGNTMMGMMVASPCGVFRAQDPSALAAERLNDILSQVEERTRVRIIDSAVTMALHDESTRESITSRPTPGCILGWAMLRTPEPALALRMDTLAPGDLVLTMSLNPSGLPEHRFAPVWGVWVHHTPPVVSHSRPVTWDHPCWTPEGGTWHPAGPPPEPPVAVPSSRPPSPYYGLQFADRDIQAVWVESVGWAAVFGARVPSPGYGSIPAQYRVATDELDGLGLFQQGWARRTPDPPAPDTPYGGCTGTVRFEVGRTPPAQVPIRDLRAGDPLRALTQRPDGTLDVVWDALKVILTRPLHRTDHLLRPRNLDASSGMVTALQPVWMGTRTAPAWTLPWDPVRGGRPDTQVYSPVMTSLGVVGVWADGIGWLGPGMDPATRRGAPRTPPSPAEEAPSPSVSTPSRSPCPAPPSCGTGRKRARIPPTEEVSSRRAKTPEGCDMAICEPLPPLPGGDEDAPINGGPPVAIRHGTVPPLFLQDPEASQSSDVLVLQEQEYRHHLAWRRRKCRGSPGSLSPPGREAPPAAASEGGAATRVSRRRPPATQVAAGGNLGLGTVVAAMLPRWSTAVDVGTPVAPAPPLSASPSWLVVFLTLILATAVTCRIYRCFFSEEARAFEELRRARVGGLALEEEAAGPPPDYFGLRGGAPPPDLLGPLFDHDRRARELGILPAEDAAQESDTGTSSDSTHDGRRSPLGGGSSAGSAWSGDGQIADPGPPAARPTPTEPPPPEVILRVASFLGDGQTPADLKVAVYRIRAEKALVRGDQDLAANLAMYAGDWTLGSVGREDPRSPPDPWAVLSAPLKRCEGGCLGPMLPILVPGPHPTYSTVRDLSPGDTVLGMDVTDGTVRPARVVRKTPREYEGPIYPLLGTPTAWVTAQHWVAAPHDPAWVCAAGSPLVGPPQLSFVTTVYTLDIDGGSPSIQLCLISKGLRLAAGDEVPHAAPPPAPQGKVLEIIFAYLGTSLHLSLDCLAAVCIEADRRGVPLSTLESRVELYMSRHVAPLSLA